jgi:hypothetical protein
MRAARGQATVEFGLVAILFFTLLFGIFDFGVVLNDWISGTTAASVGARQAAVGACFEGPAADPTVCGTGETSILGAVMASAPLMATDVDCQYSIADPATRCIGRVDFALKNLNTDVEYCRDAEVWLTTQTARAGSTTTVVQTTGTSWAANSLIGGRFSFTSGANRDVTRTVISNTATSLALDSALSTVPAVGDTFEIATLHVQDMPSAWLTCSTTYPTSNINDTLRVAVRAWVALPAAFPPMPSQMEVVTTSTVRYEGEFIQ